MLRGSADLSCLQRMMGHSRLDTTGIYLSATAEDLKAAMGHHPLVASHGGGRLPGVSSSSVPPAGLGWWTWVPLLQAG